VTLTTKVLIGLVAGLALGAVISASGVPGLQGLPGYIEPIGTLWVNALRMTVIPLVVSAILLGVISLPDPKTIGRIGGRALLLFIVSLALAATIAVMLGPIIFAHLPIDQAGAAALRASVASTSQEALATAQKMQTFKQWLVELIPTNPIKSAADGAMLPLIIFSLALGLGITRISSVDRAAVMRLVRGVLEASLTIVRWVLVAAPIGVFAIALPLAARLGVAAAGAVIYYMVAVSGVCVLLMALWYLAAALIGRQPIRAFARATAPAQAVAFSSRSSLVSLPAMLEGAETVLRLPLAVRSFFLPLAVAVFRSGGAIGISFGVVFLARLYGIELSAQQLTTIALTAVLTTFSVPGIPSGSIIVMVPILMSAGLPVDGIGLLLGVDTIPDMFRTATNVTGDMAGASILARFERVSEVSGEVLSEPVAQPGDTARVAESGVHTS
jgi:Na+/H+-dicarboxylate symporter